MKVKLLKKIRKRAEIKITTKNWIKPNDTYQGHWFYNYSFIIKNKPIFGVDNRFDYFIIDLLNHTEIEGAIDLLRERENRRHDRIRLRNKEKEYNNFKHKYFNI